MRVLSQCGSTVGHVIDVSPVAARAMLADGRAVALTDPPSGDPINPPVGPPVGLSDAVAPTSQKGRRR